MNWDRPLRGRGFKRPQLVRADEYSVFKQVFRLQASNLSKTSTREIQELKNLHLFSHPLPLRWIGDV